MPRGAQGRQGVGPGRRGIRLRVGIADEELRGVAATRKTRMFQHFLQGTRLHGELFKLVYQPLVIITKLMIYH